MARKRTPPEMARSRARLMRTATDLFASQGYEATTIDQIVAAAGYTRGALYWHFESKDDLFLAVYEAAVEDFASTVLSRVAGTADCRERVRRAIVAVIEESMLHRQVAALQRSYDQAFGRTGRRRSKALEHQYQTFESEMARIIKAGVKRGEFRSVDPELAAAQVAGVVEHVGTALRDDPEHFADINSAEETAEFCLRGLVLGD